MIDHLPQLPTHVADPEIAGAAVDAHAPRVAEAVGPDFRAGAGCLHERVVGRHSVGLARVLVIDVDAENGRQQVADILSGVEGIGRVRVGAVAGRDVEKAVLAELEIAAVMAAGQPGDDDFLRARIDARWIRVRHLEAGHARAIRKRSLGLARQHIANIAVAVFLELRMKRQPVERVQPLGALDLLPVRESLRDVEEQICLGAGGIHRKGKDLAELFADEKAIHAGRPFHQEWVIEAELGKGALDAIRGRWIGGAGDARRGPGHALRDAVGAFCSWRDGCLPSESDQRSDDDEAGGVRA